MLTYMNLSPAMQYLCLGAPLFAVFFILLWSFRSYSRLRHVPGPFVAAWTNLPRLSWVLSNRAHDIHIQLHGQYGKLVRFGPNMVSVSDPAEIPTIYGFNPAFQKVSEFSTTSKFGQVLPSLLTRLVGLLPCTTLLRQRKASPDDFRNTK